MAVLGIVALLYCSHRFLRCWFSRFYDTPACSSPPSSSWSTSPVNDASSIVSTGYEDTKRTRLQRILVVHSATNNNNKMDSKQQRQRDQAQTDTFLTYSQPLVQTLMSRGMPLNVGQEEWTQQILQWHIAQTVGQGTSRSRKGRASKRPRHDTDNNYNNNSVASSSTAITAATMTTTSTPDELPASILAPSLQKRSAVHTEADPALLSYMLDRHEQTLAQATLGMLVDLTAGQAASTQRKRKRLLYKERFQQPSVLTSESWRRVYEQGICVAGDYRDAAVVAATAKEAQARAVAAAATTTSGQGYGTRKRAMSEDYQGTWKAVLACGRTMERHLQEKRPICLSAVLSFVGHAHQLPIPEKVFDGSVASHMAEEISACLWALLTAVSVARKYQAKLLDAWYEAGVELDTLRKLLDAAASSTSITLDEAPEMERQMQVVTEWLSRLEPLLNPAASTSSEDSNNSTDSDDDEMEDRNDLMALELMAEEAMSHGFRCKGLVQLQRKIENAHQLRDRILEWSQACKKGEQKETIKFVSAIVRDIRRLKLRYPVVTELLCFHRDAESWVDRANIAIRSRISLDEIKDLIEKGEEMPLDLTEYLDKLRNRSSLAEDWLDRFKEVVPCPETAHGEPIDMLEWMQRMRDELNDGEGRISLHDLVSGGGRIPVEVDCVKLLQVELDARNWMAKARLWIPTSGENDESSSKKGRLDDLRDHVVKADALRDKLTLSQKDKGAWVLDGEAELRSIVDAADDWFEKHEEFLEGDNRRNSTRCCLSIDKLRGIVEEGNSIYANVGNATSKMAKILVQAETWYEDYHPLLVRCNLRGEKSSNSIVEMTELIKAAEAAASDVSLDLDEAMEVQALVEKIENWTDRASFASGNKRQRRGKKATFSVDDLFSLIEEASTLPIETEEDVKVLQEQAKSVQTWQARASADLERILVGFQQLQDAVTETYGLPAEFTRDLSKDDIHNEKDDPQPNTTAPDTIPIDDDETDFVEEKKAGEDMSQCETESTVASEYDLSLSCIGNGDCNVHVLIRAFCKDAKYSCISTPEGETAAQLEIVSRWCIRSLKYLDNPKDVFDKRFFGAFDRFVAEGNDLVKLAASGTEDTPDGEDLLHRLCSRWGTLLSEQVERLHVLLSERERFVAWCKSVEQALASEDRRPSIDKLKELTEKSHDFPSTSGLIQQIRTLTTKATDWVEGTSEILDSEDKLTIHEAKAIFDEGDKLGFQCDELRSLRNGLKTARSWANRVKRSKLDQGAIHVNSIKALLEEHDELIVEMPEELAKLQQAMKNYCICRRPYEGFMIGCDDCVEWFHGACIGVSETRADRVDKYVCVRCCVSRGFKNSASNVAGVIRKYCNGKDLRKARQVEAQKHQRKVRKETKDIGKLKEEAEAIAIRLKKQFGQNVLDSSTPAVGTQEAIKNQSSAQSTSEQQTSVTHESEGSMGLYSQPSEVSADGESTTAKATTSTEDASSINEETSQLHDSQIELESKLLKLQTSINKCESRLSKLAESAEMRIKQTEMEDSNMMGLRTWSIRVRSMVLIPSSDELANQSRPNQDGSLSKPMLSLIQEAEKFGLKGFEDVNIVANGFRCMSWSLRATSLLARQPSVTEIESLVEDASSLALPDEKGLRMLKSMSGRALSWQNKVSKLLAPVPGENRPFNVDAMKEFSHASDDIPLCLPLAPRLITVIEDKGARHCLCGGPSDGRFMVSCDKCDGWFHGHCVKLSKDASEELEDWKCPRCTGNEPDTVLGSSENFHDKFDIETEEVEDISPNAPNPDIMWPPFGLLGSEKAKEVLGEECCAIPDDLHERTTAVHEVAPTGLNVAVFAPMDVAGSEMHIELPSQTTSSTLAPSLMVNSTVAQDQGTAIDLLAGLSVVPLVAGASSLPQMTFNGHAFSFPGALSQFAGTGLSSLDASLNAFSLPHPEGNTTTQMAIPAHATSLVGTGWGPLVTELSTAVHGNLNGPKAAVGSERNVAPASDQPFTGSVPLPTDEAIVEGASVPVADATPEPPSASEDVFMHESSLNTPSVQEIMVAPMQDSGYE